MDMKAQKIQELLDSWKILGATPDSTEAELKKKRKDLARELHPDSNGNGPDFTRQMAMVNHAYDVASVALLDKQSPLFQEAEARFRAEQSSPGPKAGQTSTQGPLPKNTAPVGHPLSEAERDALFQRIWAENQRFRANAEKAQQETAEALANAERERNEAQAEARRAKATPPPQPAGKKPWKAIWAAAAVAVCVAAYGIHYARTHVPEPKASPSATGGYSLGSYVGVSNPGAAFSYCGSDHKQRTRPMAAGEVFHVVSIGSTALGVFDTSGQFGFVWPHTVAELKPHEPVPTGRAEEKKETILTCRPG